MNLSKSVIKIVHTTISPCENERRIFNQAITAHQNGYSVEILALKIPELPKISHVNNFIVRRIYIRFWKQGPLKFLLFNFRLFFILMRYDYQILHVHDLWVLPASVLANLFKNGVLIYDAHEYVRGLQIFKIKKLSGLIWSLTERILIRSIDCLIAVNSWHRQLYLQNYSFLQKTTVIMNYPLLKDSRLTNKVPPFQDRKEIVLFQGILKEGRGLREIIEAMKMVKKGHLEIIGDGELESELRMLIESNQIQERIHLRGKIGWKNLLNETQKARAGLVLFEPLSLNYKYASPNKFFEYVMAGTPLIASAIPTFEKFNKEFEVAILVDPYNPQEIAQATELLLTNKDFWDKYHQNCLLAREKWNWEFQEKVLIKLYADLSKNFI